jgi:hypothetical protein
LAQEFIQSFKEKEPSLDTWYISRYMQKKMKYPKPVKKTTKKGDEKSTKYNKYFVILCNLE